MSNVRAWLSGGHVHFLQLATRLTGVTRRDAPDINQDNVSLAGVLQGAVGREVDTPVFALLLDDDTRFSHDRMWDGACSRDAPGRRFPNPSASRARRFCSS